MNALALLKQLVSISSVYPNEKEFADFLSHYLQNLGFKISKVRTNSTRYSIVATYGKSTKYLAFYGHLDTVPPDNYTRDPYKVILKDGKAMGLGCEDMKGGITAILQAGEYAVKENLPVKLIFGVDEENISQGAHDLVDSGLLKDIGFLIAGESGQVNDYTQSFSTVFGRKGRILYKAIITGKKTHAAESYKGINAIEKASEFVKILHAIKFATHTRLGKTSAVAHSIKSETDSFSIPDTCTILFSLLTTPNVKSDDFVKKIKSEAKRKKIEVSIEKVERATPYGESYEIDLKNPFFKKIKKKIFSHYKVDPIYTPSVADENIFANRLRIPVISLGPIGGGGHTKDEWVSLGSLQIVEEVYKRLILAYHNR